MLGQLLLAGAGDQGLTSWLEDAVRQQPSFGETCEQARRQGVFTLASGTTKDDESFESYLGRIAPDRLAEAHRAEPKSKPRQAATSLTIWTARQRWTSSTADCCPTSVCPRLAGSQAGWIIGRGKRWSLVASSSNPSTWPRSRRGADPNSPRCLDSLKHQS